jgi:hypothetical protein
MGGCEGMHQHLPLTHVIVRYDTLDLDLAVVVASATSLQEASVLLRVFRQLAPCFAPTALYAIRDMASAPLSQKRLA